MISPRPPTRFLSPDGVSVPGALILQPWDTISLIQVDLGSIRGRARAHLCSLKHTKTATLYLLYTSLCTGVLNAIRKQNAFSTVLSTEGPVAGLRWAKFKPEGPKVALLCLGTSLPRWLVRAFALRKLFLEGVSFYMTIQTFGVVTDCSSP